MSSEFNINFSICLCCTYS